MVRNRVAGVAALFAVAISPVTAAQQAAITVDPNGAVHAPTMVVPFSAFASPQAKAAFLDQQEHPWPTAAKIEDFREEVTQYLQPYLNRAKAMYPVAVEPRTIAGVRTDVFTPAAGTDPRNAHRVLVNLHGGGFLFGAGIIGALESIPVASLGKIEVITVDYREGPESKFPAASEDVAAVYRDLLRSYEPRDIGIYGCSAGGVLTAEAIAWFQKEKLPPPGAIGIFCASAGGWSEGDSAYFAPILDGEPLSPANFKQPHQSVGNVPYFADADFNDPLVAPIRSAAVLAKFPPTLVITATRDFALSSAINTHTQLIKLGVDAELHVWDGLDHSFFTNPDLPESREVWTVVVNFFDRHLGHS